MPASRAEVGQPGQWSARPVSLANQAGVEWEKRQAWWGLPLPPRGSNTRPALCFREGLVTWDLSATRA